MNKKGGSKDEKSTHNKQTTQPTKTKSTTSSSYKIDNPEKNFKKLKEIKYNVDGICTEIDNKFKVIKSADSEFDNLLKNEELEKQKAEDEETRRKEELEKETDKELEEVKEEAIKETPELVREEETDDETTDDETDEEEIKIDDSNEIITLRKRIEDQKSSYERINEMLKALIGVLEEKYINKNQVASE